MTPEEAKSLRLDAATRVLEIWGVRGARLMATAALNAADRAVPVVTGSELTSALAGGDAQQEAQN